LTTDNISKEDITRNFVNMACTNYTLKKSNSQTKCMIKKIINYEIMKD